MMPLKVWIGLFYVLWAVSVYGLETVRVIAVVDGDTVKVLSEKTQEKVRLLYIDAPEMDQPYGKKAKKVLAKRIFGQDVELERHGRDQYGRTLAVIHFENKSMNLEMVANGYAWVYKQYTRDPIYLEAELKARRQRKGLWKLPKDQRVPPWKWRRKNK